MKAQAGEVYTVCNQHLKHYTACQVGCIAPPDTVSTQPWAVILSLGWVGNAPLTAEELPHLRPLYKDFMYWPRALHLLRVPVEIPPQCTLVGTLPPFTDEPCLSYRRPGDGSIVFLNLKSGRVRGYNCDYADLVEIAESFSSPLLSLVEQALELEKLRRAD